MDANTLASLGCYQYDIFLVIWVFRPSKILILATIMMAILWTPHHLPFINRTAMKTLEVIAS